MDTGLFLALLNPAIALVLATAFGMLWLYQRRQSYLAVLATGYVASAIGFLLEYFTFPAGSTPTEFTASAAFTAAVCLISCAIVSRYGRRLPLVAIGVSAVAGFAVYCWFLFASPDLNWRILALNFTFGAISLVVAAELRVVRKRGPTEAMLFVLTLLASANFVVRTLIVLSIQGPFEGRQGFENSMYWTTAMLSHALLSLMLALCLFTAAALDVVAALRSDSHTDALSGLLNRRGFEARAAQILAQYAGSGLPVALVVADLDHFKAINDRYGHAAGDRVIADFAAALRHGAGRQGIAARVGGEEFAVLLPLADLAAARLFAEAVRTAFHTGADGELPPGTRVTASFGIATRAGDEEPERLMKRADDALYKAKQSGRDSVRVAYERLPQARGVEMSRPG